MCDLVELPFRNNFTFSRKLKGYEPHTISKRRDVTCKRSGRQTITIIDRHKYKFKL